MAGSKRSAGLDSTTIPPGLHFVQTRPPLCSMMFYCAPGRRRVGFRGRRRGLNGPVETVTKAGGTDENGKREAGQFDE